MKNINILFLGGAKRVSLAEKFIEAGKNLRYNVNIFSYELDENVPISFIGKIIIGKKWNDRKIYDHLEDIIKKYAINIMLPCVDPAIKICARFKKLTKKDVFIPVSEEEKVNIFYNKKNANIWCIRNNIPIPPKELNFPMIAKPLYGSASKGILIISEINHYNELQNKKEEYFIQKYIKGKEFTVDCYVSCINKKIITIVPRVRLETQGGEAIKSITKKHNAIINISKDILKMTGIIGPINIQFIEEEDTGNIYFIELNTRFGGAVLTSIAAGADIPGFLLKNYLGVKQKYYDNWKENLMMIRRFKEYYKQCK